MVSLTSAWLHGVMSPNENLDHRSPIPTTTREVRLAGRPRGLPTEALFDLAVAPLAPLRAGEVLLRNLWMSVDPYMRGRMDAGDSYLPPFESAPLSRARLSER